MQNNFNLDELKNPQMFHQRIQLENTGGSLDLVASLDKMLLIRRVEEVIAEKIKEGHVKCPCHLAIGQEAVGVGVANAIAPTDSVYGNHRSHAHFLALGGTPYSLFAEVLGKKDGCSRGFGGSMHLCWPGSAFKGSVPIVAGTVPMAVGAGLASYVMEKESHDVGIAFFGDGAAEEGVVHECMNFVGSFKLPVIFLCENNLFSSHLHIDYRQPFSRVSRFGEANGLNSITVDGNDVVAVTDAVKQAVELARKGEGGSFIECVTYRWRGHVGPSEDIDVGLARKDDLSQWKKRDPIERLFQSLVAKKIVEKDYLEQRLESLNRELEEDWERAMLAEEPEHELLESIVYGK